MKRSIAAMLLILSHQICFGEIDGISVPAIESLYDKLETDTVTNPLKGLTGNNIITDSLAALQSRLDSIKKDLSYSVDSLKQLYSIGLTNIQFTSQRYQSIIDSLKFLKLPINNYQSKIDSLFQEVTSFRLDLDFRIEDIKRHAMEKIKEIPLTPELNEKFVDISTSINNLKMESLQADLTERLNFGQLGLPTRDVSSAASVSSINVTGSQNIAGSLTSDQTLPDVPALKDIKGMDNISGLSEKTGEIQSKLSEVPELNGETIDRLAESNASQLKGVSSIQEQTANLPPITMKSEEEAKAEIKSQIQAIAVDHFANNQEQLKSAMEKMSRYKLKYSNVNSLTEISKRPTNAMKGKPVIERMVPGLALQIQKKGDHLLVDFNPYLGYRFTSRIIAGVGWNQRVPCNLDTKRFSSTARIYGPRLFGEFKLNKGFAPRVEAELMHTRVPPLTQLPAIDPANEEWVWGVFAGIKKEYRLFRSIKGTASVMLRLFDPHHKSPYGDVVNARLGFEFPLKKKVKPQRNS